MKKPKKRYIVNPAINPTMTEDTNTIILFFTFSVKIAPKKTGWKAALTLHPVFD
jgi:hypothetical protein